MKKIILISLSFILSCNIYSQQYGWIKILDSDSCSILGFEQFKHSSVIKKDIYVLFGRPQSSGTNPQQRYNTWHRYDKNSSTWYILSHNSFLHSNPYFCPWPLVNAWIYYTVIYFVISPVDTNLILEVRDVPPCGYNPPLEPAQDTRITYNNGITIITYPQFGNSFIGNMCSGFDIDPVNDSIIYLGYPLMQTMTYCLWKSTNRGVNWFVTDTVGSQGGKLRINPSRRNDLFIASNSLMYKSTSSGYNFYNLGIKEFDYMAFDITDYSIYGMTHLLPTQGLFKSTNNGDNWFLLKSGIYNYIEINPDNHNILYLGSDSGLYRSMNAGLNWALYNNSFTPSKRIIGISKDQGTGDTLYVSTNKAVYKVWGPYVGIIKISSSIPLYFTLHQNYPNPFNPVTKIKFSLPSPSKGGVQTVRLLVYDVIGREIAKLIPPLWGGQEELSPGTYEVEWDGTNYPSGVYFYKLIISDASAPLSITKKMVLIK